MNKLLYTAAILLFATAFTSAKAQTADEIVKKNIEATGGEKNWHSVKTLKETGLVVSTGGSFNITVTVVNEQEMRIDVTLAGVNGYTIITQKEGWVFFPFQGQTAPQEMTADQVKLAQNQMDVRGDLFDYKKKGSTVAYEGKDTIDGKNCYKLLLTDKNNRKETMYIDTATNYLVHAINKVNVSGTDMEVVVMYDNYQRTPEGVVLPMDITSKGSTMKFSAVEINKPVDEAIFKPSLK